MRPSEIAGRGLFAVEDLPAGTVVLRMAGRSDRVDGLGSRFPNHSCDANLGWLDEVTLVTMTEVAAGAELVIDYAHEHRRAGLVPALPLPQLPLPADGRGHRLADPAAPGEVRRVVGAAGPAPDRRQP